MDNYKCTFAISAEMFIMNKFKEKISTQIPKSDFAISAKFNKCIIDFLFITLLCGIFFKAPVAQLVAHQTSNLRVAGSIPVWCDFF
jgi:hypothetical protein